ncbi:MAG: hypothetical protein P3W90_003620, partial [Paracoccus sp. (in: a-proteobacteria)]|nr:hypothetical protein [Paracoccus sp. (in: a-proteobacteria)]
TSAGVPHPRSLLGRLLARHGIDPELAPLPMPPAPDAPAAAPVTQLRPAAPPTAEPAPDQAADPLAPPRAAMAASLPASPVPPVSAPQRARDFNLALYRLLLRARGGDNDGDGGAPEVVALGRPQDIAPLLNTLAAMLPKARMRAMAPDMTTPQTLAETALDLGEPDVIIDDTSTNARQKQLNFLAFFATLKPGGLYLIECLHDDANALETLALFRSFLDCGGFVHPDPAFGRDFAVMQPEIDGCFIIAGRDKKDQTIVLHRR